MKKGAHYTGLNAEIVLMIKPWYGIFAYDRWLFTVNREG